MKKQKYKPGCIYKFIENISMKIKKQLFMYSFLIIFHLILFEYVDRLCGYVNHYEDVSDRCDRQNNCTLDPLLYKERSGVNPCTSNSLYLHITYRCISEEQTYLSIHY